MSRSNKIMKDIMSASPMRIALSVLLGFAIGSLFMAVFNENVVSTYATILSDPSLTLSTAGQTIVDGYGALFKGSIVNLSAEDPVSMFRPITETLRLSAPLIMAGLGVALGFRVGLFNVGGTGQLVMGLLGATWVSTRLELPWGLHMVVALVVAVIFAAATGGFVGYFFHQSATGVTLAQVPQLLRQIDAYLVRAFNRIVQIQGNIGNSHGRARRLLGAAGVFFNRLFIHTGVRMVMRVFVGVVHMHGHIVDVAALGGQTA